MTESEPTTPTDYADDTSAPEPTTPPAGDTPPILDEIPAWARKFLDEVESEFTKVWTDLFEHHHRVESVISDLRRYSIPLTAIENHYETYSAPLPASTPDSPTPDAQLDAAANG